MTLDVRVQACILFGHRSALLAEAEANAARLLRRRDRRSPNPRLSRETRCPLERRRSAELPAVALQYVLQLALVHRCEFAAGPLLPFNQSACSGRSIEEQHASGFRAGALPGMRHAARHEGAGTGPAHRDLIADLEGDFAAQDIGHLVAVVM